METHDQEPGLGERLVLTYKAVRSHWLKLLLAFVIPFGIIAGSGFFSPSVYKSQMIARVNYMSNNEANFFLTPLRELSEAADYQALSQNLNIEPGRIKALKSFRFDKLRDRTEGFIITVNVTDISLLPVLDTAFKNYFDNSDYIRKKVTRKKNSIVNQMEAIDKEIRFVDSLRLVISKTGLADTLLIAYLKTNIKQNIIGLKEKQDELGEKFAESEGLVVLQSFSKPYAPESRFRKNSFAFGLVGGIIGFYIMYLVTNYRYRKTGVNSKS